MAKKNLSKILTSGTPKQRILLLSEDIARAKLGKDKTLSDQEFFALRDSFNTPNEIKLYNQFKDADLTVIGAIINLQGLLFEVKMRYSDLRGYILMWLDAEKTEFLVNSILHEIKDPEERKRIAKVGAENSSLLFSKNIIDPEGYLDIEIDFEEDSYIDENGEIIKRGEKPRKTKENTLWDVMNTVKEDVILTASKWLGWRKALDDYIEEKGFHIKVYKEQLSQMDKDLHTPIIGWPKYYGELNMRMDLEFPRIDPLMEKYNICPNISDIEYNKEEYQWFKDVVIADE